MTGGNEARSAEAAERNVARARAGMRWLMNQPSARTAEARRRQNVYYDALWARMLWPTATLAEIAQQCGITKDAYAALLRRALRYTERGIAA